MKKIGMGGKYPAMVKPYHSMKNIPDKFFNWFSGKTGGKFIVHSKKQMNKLAKSTLINRVVFLEKLVFNLAYELYKAKLPQLKTIKQKALPKRKTKKKVGIIYTAKNGRKYKILASGKARFVKS